MFTEILWWYSPRYTNWFHRLEASPLCQEHIMAELWEEEKKFLLPLSTVPFEYVKWTWLGWTNTTE